MENDERAVRIVAVHFDKKPGACWCKESTCMMTLLSDCCGNSISFLTHGLMI